jgi:hypothetical protein
MNRLLKAATAVEHRMVSLSQACAIIEELGIDLQHQPTAPGAECLRRELQRPAAGRAAERDPGPLLQHVRRSGSTNDPPIQVASIWRPRGRVWGAPEPDETSPYE